MCGAAAGNERQPQKLSGVDAEICGRVRTDIDVVNEYIKKIVAYAPDKSSGHQRRVVKIYINFVGEVEVPAISELIIYEKQVKCRKTA